MNHARQFEEVLCSQQVPGTDAPSFQNPLTEAYVGIVDSSDCSSLIRRLAQELPSLSSKTKLGEALMDWSHLKRVKRHSPSMRASGDEDANKDSDFNNPQRLVKVGSVSSGFLEVDSDMTPESKRMKKSPEIKLEVLLGAVPLLNKIFVSDDTGSSLNDAGGGEFNSATMTGLQQKFGLDSVQVRVVPARAAQSTDEWKEFKEYWPCTYFPNKTIAFQHALRELSDEEIANMNEGMRAAIDDLHEQRNRQNDLGKAAGVVIVCPRSGRIVSSAAVERDLQSTSSQNPHQTSILYAIQGVSRLERAKASSQGMNSAAFQEGQYLCTGYDVYTTLEPSVFEAMALVHSRIRRLVFGYSHVSEIRADNHLCSGIKYMRVHALPGTNHKYRAFQCTRSSDLGIECRLLHGLEYLLKPDSSAEQATT